LKIRSVLLSLVAVLIILPLGLFGCKEKEVKLTYGETPVKAQRYKQTTVGKVTTTVGGKTADAEIRSEIVFLETVSEVKPEGTLEKRIVYESGWIKTGKTRSELPIKGKVVALQMDEKGQLLDVKGITELFTGQRSTLDLRRLLEENQLIFPSKPLKLGESWSYNKRFDLSNIGELRLKGRAKMASLEKRDRTRIAKIVSSLEGSMFGEKKFQDVTFVLKGEEKGEATTYFGVEDKTVVEHKSHIKGSFEVAPTGAPTPQAQPLKTQFDLSTTITASRQGT